MPHFALAVSSRALRPCRDGVACPPPRRRHRLVEALAALICASAAACAVPADRQYHAAVGSLREGHARAYYDAMVRLAAQSPQERAGRRARAVLLSSNGALDEVVALALVARSGQAGGGRSEEGEAASDLAGENVPQAGEPVQQLRALAELQDSYHRAHGRFCADFAECPFEPPVPAHYYYFLGQHAVAGGSDSQETVEAEGQIRAWLHARRLLRHSDRQHYQVVAVGLIGDAGVDVWTLDQRRQPMHLNDDPRPARRQRAHGHHGSAGDESF